MRFRTRSRSRRESTWSAALIGLATAAVIAVVAWVSFTANSGLPWQRTYDIAVEIPNADRLIGDSDVRIAGTRVGRVASVEAIPAGDGRPARARVQISLQRSAGPLPADTRTRVRPASVLGASFLELEPGRSTRRIPAGGALRPPVASPTVDLTDLLDVFDRSTRASFRGVIRDLGSGLRGRGTAIGTTLSSTADLLDPLTGVAGELAHRDTRFGAYLTSFEETVTTLGSVRDPLVRLLDHGATTFAALARRPHALGAAIDRAAPAERATARAFASIRPGLRDLAALTRQLRPAARQIAPATRDVTRILRAAHRPLRQVPGFGTRLQTAARELAGFAVRPSTTIALKEVAALARATSQTLEVLAPAQKHCNVVGLYSQNFASVIGVMGVGEGPSLDLTGIATTGAPGETLQNKELSPGIAINYFPHANEQECESGNERHTGKQSINNPPGVQGTSARRTTPPPGVLELARGAGLLDRPGR